jgi:hypothetical protein
MPNLIVAYDHLDERIGSNCYQCYQHLDSEINLSGYNAQILNGKDCSSQKVQEAITALSEQAFIFIAYSHGKEDALFSHVEPDGYVTTHNAYFFGKSLIYTNSCYTAMQLKSALLDSHCLGYVGYEDRVRVPENSADEALFIACENKGIVHFLTTNDTIFESFKVMKDYYQEEYDKLVYRDFVLASRLLRNQECLVIVGNLDLTKNDFVIV